MNLSEGFINDFVRVLARAIFVRAYASACDEHPDMAVPRAKAQQNWFDVAPTTPDDAYVAAARWLGWFERENEQGFEFLWPLFRACAKDGQEIGLFEIADRLIEQATGGGGDGWTDRHPSVYTCVRHRLANLPEPARNLPAVAWQAIQNRADDTARKEGPEQVFTVEVREGEPPATVYIWFEGRSGSLGRFKIWITWKDQGYEALDNGGLSRGKGCMLTSDEWPTRELQIPALEVPGTGYEVRLQEFLPEPFNLFTDSDWRHLRSEVARMRDEYHDDPDLVYGETELPEEAVMTSQGYVTLSSGEEDGEGEVTYGGVTLPEESWPEVEEDADA